MQRAAPPKPPPDKRRNKKDVTAPPVTPARASIPTAACGGCPFRGYCLPRGLEWLHIGNRKRLITVPRVAHRGEMLYRASQYQQSLYFVKAGSVKIAIASAEGVDQIVRFLLPGDLVGADSLEGGSTVSMAIALETTGLCELPAHQLGALSQRFATVQHRLIKLLARQLSQTQTMLLVLGKQSAEERVASFLIDLKRRFDARGLSSEEFNLSMTRCDIASYLGLAVETVSRVFRRLQKQGLLSVRGRRVSLRDICALQLLAGISSKWPNPQKPLPG